MGEDIETKTVFCPVCNWAILEAQIERIKIDTDCPGCDCRKLSEFGRFIYREPPDSADWWKNR